MAPIPRAFVAAVIAFALLTACSVMFPTSSLRGGDGGDDAATDGVSPVDGAIADAPQEASDGGGRWCATQPQNVFCDDFDDEGPFGRWSGDYLRGGGTVARDGTAFRSAPNAFLAVTPGSNGPTSAALYFLKSGSKLHVAYDMKIDARDPQSGYAEINYVRLGAASPDSAAIAAIYMRVFADSMVTTGMTAEAYLPDGGIPQHDVSLTGNPRFDQWTRVDLNVDLASAVHTMAVGIDGVVVAMTTLEASLYPTGPLEVELGLRYTASPSSGWRIRYDNVTISTE